MRPTLLWLSLASVYVSCAWASAGQTLPQKTAEPAVDVYGDPLPAGAIARIGTMRLRHAGAVTCLAFSPDSAQLFSASHDKTICMWDARTGKLRRRFTGHEDAVF